MHGLTGRGGKFFWEAFVEAGALSPVRSNACVRAARVSRLVDPDDEDPPALIYEPQESSPAIDEADKRACPRIDQRGVKRPKDGNGTTVCDVGSVEARPPGSGV